MINPYANVDWANYLHVHSLSHSHISTQQHFNSAYDAGIRHFAPSNYHPGIPKYSLSDYFTVPLDVIGSPNAEHLGYINTGMHCTTPGSTYADTGDTTNLPWETAFDAFIAELQYPLGGGIIVNHVKWSGLAYIDVLKCLDYAPEVLGIEVYNDASEYSKGLGWSNEMWDAILKTGRRCWGFFVPDWSGIAYSGWYGRNVLLIPTATEENSLMAYRNGSLYGCIYGTGLKFTGITATANQVTVTTNSATHIKFISDKGEMVINASSGIYSINNDVYVRIEATDGTERIFSQPIIYQEYVPVADDDTAKKRKRKIIIL